MSGKEIKKNIDRLFRTDQNQDGDNFGLPDTGNSSSGGIPTNQGTDYKASDFEPEERSRGLAIILVILFLFVIVFLVYWFMIRKPKVEPVTLPQDTTKVQVPVDTTAVTESVKTDTVPIQLPSGEISTITERTGRYYVVISSSIDSDLANDYAKKLSKEGISCKILGPASGRGFYKVTIGDFGTFAEANSRVEEAKGTYGSEIWVLKF